MGKHMCSISEKDVKEMYKRTEWWPSRYFVMLVQAGPRAVKLFIYGFFIIGIRTLRDAAQGLECP